MQVYRQVCHVMVCKYVMQVWVEHFVHAIMLCMHMNTMQVKMMLCMHMNFMQVETMLCMHMNTMQVKMMLCMLMNILQVDNMICKFMITSLSHMPPCLTCGSNTFMS